MRAANKVSDVYTADGASRVASTAAGAKRIIYNRKIILELYCAHRAGLFALTAANAAVSANASYRCTSVVVRAFDDDS